jgi:Tfp pilus assembly protein PilZ
MATASIHTGSGSVAVEPPITTGTAVGTIDRTYGLLVCEEIVRVNEVLDRSGDLAVADRVAYLCARRTRSQVVVVELDGWYHAVVLDRYLSVEQAGQIKPLAASPRLMSLVDSRGIMPLVSPLAQ